MANSMRKYFYEVNWREYFGQFFLGGSKVPTMSLHLFCQRKTRQKSTGFDKKPVDLILCSESSYALEALAD